MGSATQDFACLTSALAASLALAQHHPLKPILIKAEAASSVSATQRRDEAAGTCSFCPSSLAGARRSHRAALPLVTPARTAVPVPRSSGGSSHRALAWLSPLQSGDRHRGVPGLQPVLGFVAHPGPGGLGAGLGAHRRSPPWVTLAAFALTIAG